MNFFFNLLRASENQIASTVAISAAQVANAQQGSPMSSQIVAETQTSTNSTDIASSSNTSGFANNMLTTTENCSPPITVANPVSSVMGLPVNPGMPMMMPPQFYGNCEYVFGDCV